MQEAAITNYWYQVPMFFFGRKHCGTSVLQLPGHFFSHGGVLSVVGEIADDEVHVQEEGGQVVAHVGQALHQVEP